MSVKMLSVEQLFIAVLFGTDDRLGKIRILAKQVELGNCISIYSTAIAPGCVLRRTGTLWAGHFGS